MMEATLTGHTDRVWSVVFSPDGRADPGHRQPRPRRWDLDPPNDLRGHLIERACAIAGRGLTSEEWAIYLPGERWRDTCAEAR
jgi:hypothetical protein